MTAFLGVAIMARMASPRQSLAAALSRSRARANFFVRAGLGLCLAFSRASRLGGGARSGFGCCLAARGFLLHGRAWAFFGFPAA